MPTVYVETYGCLMNVSDSELMLGKLAAEGYTPIDGPEGADVILLNTCAIREHAEQRVLGRLHDARVFLAAVNADSSISTRSLTIRSTHLSTRLSRWSLARNAARAASSAGIDKDVNFGGQSAARSADRLLAVFFRAPALCW